LLKNSGYGTTAPLNMDYFTGALLATQYKKIVYHENHDEAGNDANTERTIVTAVNYAPLIGATRTCAEARSRWVFGLSALSAGTPMFLMGEEIGRGEYFTYDGFFLNKEDLIGQRTGDGQFLFRFYQDLIPAVDRLCGGAVDRNRCHLPAQRQSRDRFHAQLSWPAVADHGQSE